MSLPKKRLTTFICSFSGCSAAYNRQDRLKIHFRTHTGERPFICAHDNCNKTFIRSQHLKRHEASHETNGTECPYENCKALLKTNWNLQRHINNIHLKKRKIHKCSYCDEKFTKHTSLKFHEYKHTGEKPYTCTEKGCGKSFVTPSKLKRHLKVHEGYRCRRKDCEVVSKTWTLHLEHVKNDHKNEFQCSTCFKLFNKRSNLKAHQNIHLDSEKRKLIRCPVQFCNKFYYEMKNLRCHYKSVHDIPIYSCTYKSCPFAFKSEENLKNHINRRHKPIWKLKNTLAAKLSGITTKPNVKLEPESICENTIHETMDEISHNETSYENSNNENSYENSNNETSNKDNTVIKTETVDENSNISECNISMKDTKKYVVKFFWNGKLLKE